jgi:hypothetical protein
VERSQSRPTAFDEAWAEAKKRVARHVAIVAQKATLNGAAH